MAYGADKVELAIRHHRISELWFGNRQPHHQSIFVKEWGEWFDDQALIADDRDHGTED